MSDEYYIVRNNQVLKGKLIKRSRRGKAYWVQINGANKKKLVAMSKMFENESEAEKFLEIRNENRLRAWKKREEEFEKEVKQIDEILLKLYIDFGYKCKILARPWTVEYANKLYYGVKKLYMTDSSFRDYIEKYM